MVTTPHTPRAKRTANEGWINVQLSEPTNSRLRQMVAESRPKVSLTAVIESAVEREWEVWEAKRVVDGKGAGE